MAWVMDIPIFTLKFTPFGCMSEIEIYEGVKEDATPFLFYSNKKRPIYIDEHTLFLCCNASRVAKAIKVIGI